MLNEFYKYIASNTISFFQGRSETLRPGERYCLRLDTEAMVLGVDLALREKTKTDGIQGQYQYNDVYSTFTIKLSSDKEVVVASKIDGMTDDFLATLRNAELTDKHFPILMITHSPIDTITSGTGDLAANGMPFHAASIIAKIKEDIKSAELSPADRILLEVELQRKQGDRFSDKSSLFEYSNLLTVLGRGYVQPTDFTTFGMLPDDIMSLLPEDKIQGRLKENHEAFDRIDRIVKYGNVEDELEKEYDRDFIEHLKSSKKKGLSWHEGYTYAMVKASCDKLKKKQDNPLQIDDGSISVYSESPREYNFAMDQLFFIRNDGDTKAKQHQKNILIYNPDQKVAVTIALNSNLTLRSTMVECQEATYSLSGKKMEINIKATGCAFARVKITDPNNINYQFKICVLNVLPKYLEEIQTCYFLNIPKNTKNSTIQAVGLNKQMTINSGCKNEVVAALKPGGEYVCNYNQTLFLSLDEEDMDVDTGYINVKLKCGAIEIPLQIKDEPIKPVELTGISAFQWKHKERRGLEYRDGKIVSSTTEFFAKTAFKESLTLENTLVQKGWFAINMAASGAEECKLDIPDGVKTAYIALINEFKRLRQLPSLAYYCGELRNLAEA